MGYLIGKPNGPSTWGQLRSVIINGTKPFTITWRPPHSLELDHGFKTALGNGFIRTDVTAMFLLGNPAEGASVFAGGVDDDPPLSIFGFTNYPGGALISEGALVDEDKAQLVGESVALNSQTISITTAAFVYYNYQQFEGYSDPTTIESIGKLTAF